jgi:phospholipase C
MMWIPIVLSLFCGAGIISRAEADIDRPKETPPTCLIPAGVLPRPNVPAGTPDPSIPIEHVFVIMSENHSFNNVLGKLTQPQYYGDEIDGIQPGQFNLDTKGRMVEPFHLGKDCVKDMDHNWNGSWIEFNDGAMDKFIARNDKKNDGYRVMGYYDQTDYPLMYALADHYAVADNFFSSVMGPTHPNRWYLYTGTSHGRVNNRFPNLLKGGWKWKTIFEQLTDAGVSWTFYHADLSTLMLFTRFWFKNLSTHIRHVSRLGPDMRKGRLAQVVFIEPSAILGEEHPPFSFKTNQIAVSKYLRMVIGSKQWPKSAFFLTYDEAGGNWDHVPPPPACKPDLIDPIRDKGERLGGFDRHGFRVPAILVSPYAKRHYVSHKVYDHTSILRFIETKFNVPSLTARDANADPMLDMFDFDSPDFSRPTLPRPRLTFRDVWDCFFKKGYRTHNSSVKYTLPGYL